MGFLQNLKDKFAKKKIVENDNADRYLDGYNKTRMTLSEKLSNMLYIFDGINDDFLEQLMITLLEADVGVETSEKIVDMVQEYGKTFPVNNREDLIECLVSKMFDVYDGLEIPEIKYNSNGTTVILVVGINGAGKTTSIAKLTQYYKNQGKRVATAAADTFRAGAVRQIQEWSNRLEVPCIAGKDQTDPSSVLVDACRYAKEHNIDILLCDTAGRLQNKSNLMKELEKMHRVIGREIDGAPHEVWLVLDATTGQNGLLQASEFLNTSKVTGVVLTKMDGTAKGGIVLAIRDKLHLPVRFVGTGETPNDIKEFDIDEFLFSIAEGIENVG